MKIGGIDPSNPPVTTIPPVTVAHPFAAFAVGAETPLVTAAPPWNWSWAVPDISASKKTRAWIGKLGRVCGLPETSGATEPEPDPVVMPILIYERQTSKR